MMLHWLMNFIDCYLLNYWLIDFVVHRNVMLMNNMLVLLHYDLFMMLMNYLLNFLRLLLQLNLFLLNLLLLLKQLVLIFFNNNQRLLFNNLNIFYCIRGLWHCYNCLTVALVKRIFTSLALKCVLILIRTFDNLYLYLHFDFLNLFLLL
jgi:hypothetical protein